MMSKKPNILIFLTDQQRWDTVGAYGSPMDLTPNIDRMAKEGVKFERAFTCNPVCGPARASLQTGKYPVSLGVHVNSIALPTDVMTLPKYLKKEGYDSGYVGKWHLSNTGVDYVPKELRGGWDGYWRGVDMLELSSEPYGGFVWDENNNQVILPKDVYRSDALTNLALDFIRKERRNPFFLFISYLEPHQQNTQKRFIAPEGYADKYRANYWVPGDLKGLPGDWRDELPDYYGMIKRLDENLGTLMAELDKSKTLDNTIIIFISDHGCHFRTRNYEYKRTCHESSIRIPMIIYGPEINGQPDVHEMVSLADLPPTILALAGVELPEDMQGKNLLPLIEHRAEKWENEVYFELSEYLCGRGLRTERWKYCVVDFAGSKERSEIRELKINFPGGPGSTKLRSDIYVEYQLYDLEKDPDEKVNLAGRPQYREVADQLRERLKRRILITEGKKSEIKEAPFYPA
jgi:arylsulfatase A-like enzyme